jgi:hypothetical protein
VWRAGTSKSGGDLYVWHGADDFRGGKATVSAVRMRNSLGEPEHWIEVDQNPGVSYNWALLANKQAELAAKFGDTGAQPEPDLRPEFNNDDEGW